MKGKRVIAAVIAVVMLLVMAPLAALAGTTPSDWAKPEMDNANISGLLTANAAKDFSRSLSRDEFCEIVVLMAEQALGAKLPLPARNPFTDCNSEYVQKAYQFGITTGTTPTEFTPNANVARQEIAAMMYRAIKGVETRLGKVLTNDPVTSLTFADRNSIDDYAQLPVRFAVANGIFKGDNFNKFNPLSAISSEECVAVAIRSHNSMQTKIDAGLTSAQLLDKTINNLNIGYALGDAQTAVSQDVILPTRGAGGTVISWSSNNPSVISNAGKVAANGGNATLTATITLGGSTRTASFTLTTTTLRGDQLRVNNAKNELTLGFFNSGDTLESVTGRVFLPTTVMGLNVSWSTSNANVIALTGEVTVPTDSSIATVYLTASFSSGSASGQKVFTLSVRNPAYATGSVYLHNIALGMPYADVTKALGNAKTSLTLATGETWYFFYSDTTTSMYNNFIAVALQSNKVVGVYTMVNGWEGYLRDSNLTSAKTITTTQANSATGTRVDTYSDPYNANKQYAAFMYDTTSTIASERTLLVGANESFITLLINAYRYLYGSGNGKLALTNDSLLSTSARNHSVDMDNYEYLSETGRVGATTFATRAYSAGSNATVLGGIVASNVKNPFDFLNSAIANSTDRAKILLANAGQIGVGYSGTLTGAQRTLLTLVFASSTNITSVSANVTAVAVQRGLTTDIVLTFNPSNFTEAFTVTSSNTAYFTVALVATSANTRTYRITGVADTVSTAPQYLYVRGADNRALMTLGVTVGARAYATGLSVTATGSVTTSHNTTAAKGYERILILGQGDTYNFSAVSTGNVGGTPVLSWSSNSTAATVSAATGAAVTIRGVTPSATPVTITVSVPTGATGTATIPITISVYVISKPVISIMPATTPINVAETRTLSLSPVPPAYGTWSYSWGSSTGAASVSNTTPTVPSSTLTAVTAGSSSISATVTQTSTTSYIASVTVTSVPVTVADGNDGYPTGATASPPNLTVQKGRQEKITINVTPTTVTSAKKIVAHTYVGTDLTIVIDADKNLLVTGNTVTATPISFIVTVEAKGGTYHNVPVTVNVVPVTPTVTITNPTTMLTAGMPYIFYATVSGTSLSLPIIWGSSCTDGVIASIDPTSGTLTIDAASTAGTITVTATVAAVPGETNIGTTTTQVTVVPVAP